MLNIEDENQWSPIYYKYRTIDNYKYFVDILLYKRLFASTYKNMNDPMEGIYYTNRAFLSQDAKNKILQEKGDIKFCCLAKRPNNMLMWSHYANGHSGIALGVRINKRDNDIQNIEYFSDHTFIDNHNEKTARDILSRKLEYWKYEQEIRIFPKISSDYIVCRIEEIILGRKISKENENLIRDMVRKIDDSIRVIKEVDVHYFD
ncbi:DUF2971 domain-containing protein [uncultured Chryseobacterium sp.]|uniref:DUF2971 domain-containing protein n=1 Tax=uncultured Chryseobacterium sp. TaxID=259322 RepID=UPI0025E6D1A4|nr:DUF2971 domain-containing protein [uncultured Chryseobacterium sp.]